MVRIKNRYITFQILYPEDSVSEYSNDASLAIHKSTPAFITPKMFSNLIKQEVKLNFGDLGLGRIANSLSVKYFSSKTSTGMIRIGRDELQLICFALMCITKLNDVGVIISIVRVSGTIRKAQDFLTQHNQNSIDEILKITA